jgi:hypothetical protein
LEWPNKKEEFIGNAIVAAVVLIALIALGGIVNLLRGPCDEICEAKRDVYSWRKPMTLEKRLRPGSRNSSPHQVAVRGRHVA